MIKCSWRRKISDQFVIKRIWKYNVEQITNFFDNFHALLLITKLQNDF